MEVGISPGILRKKKNVFILTNPTARVSPAKNGEVANEKGKKEKDTILKKNVMIQHDTGERKGCPKANQLQTRGTPCRVWECALLFGKALS